MIYKFRAILDAEEDVFRDIAIDENDTLEDFIVNGENIKWYDAQTDGNELQDSELIVSGTIYYVSQTLNGCESERLAITAGTDLKTDSFDLSQLKYYPNPTNNIVTIQNASPSGKEFKLRIIDQLGRLTKEIKYIDSLEYYITISDLP